MFGSFYNHCGEKMFCSRPIWEWLVNIYRTMSFQHLPVILYCSVKTIHEIVSNNIKQGLSCRHDSMIWLKYLLFVVFFSPFPISQMSFTGRIDLLILFSFKNKYMCFFFSSRGAVYLLSFKQTKGETVVHKLNCMYAQALSYLHIATIRCRLPRDHLKTEQTVSELGHLGSRDKENARRVAQSSQ